jgi:putative sigma-54 modulation protein
MQITISGHHVEVTPALRDYVTGKFDRLQRHFDQITNIDVTLVVEKLIQKAEATIHVSGADIFANAESEDMYAAIDLLVDKLDRQLIKHKEKSRGH